MSTRTILVVFMALISGAGMAVGVLQSNRATDTEVTTTETEEVLVATVDLQRGRIVAEADVMVRQWPKGMAPANVLREVDAAVERVVKGQILAGELILAPKLTTEEAGIGLASMVPPQMRAVTIMASSVALNVAGFVLAGQQSGRAAEPARRTRRRPDGRRQHDDPVASGGSAGGGSSVASADG
jgi:Flp pilus assembly protein CpaB